MAAFAILASPVHDGHGMRSRHKEIETHKRVYNRYIAEQKKQASFRVVLLAFFLLCDFVAATVIYDRARFFFDYQNSMDWPMVTGQVTLSEVRQDCRLRYGGMGYRHALAYDYHIAEHGYQGQRLFPEPLLCSANPQEMLDYQMAYPQGKVVEVRYNPQRPEEAFLRQNEFSWFSFCLNIVALGGLLFFFWKQAEFVQAMWQKNQEERQTRRQLKKAILTRIGELETMPETKLPVLQRHSQPPMLHRPTHRHRHNEYVRHPNERDET